MPVECNREVDSKNLGVIRGMLDAKFVTASFLPYFVMESAS